MIFLYMINHIKEENQNVNLIHIEKGEEFVKYLHHKT